MDGLGANGADIVDVTGPRGKSPHDARWQRLLASAIDLARHAYDLTAAVTSALDLALDYAGLPLGHAYLADDSGSLHATGMWRHRGENRFDAFVAASEELVLKPGEGLPGAALAAGMPVWIGDIGSADGFPRRDAALAAGIRCGIAIPITTGHEVSGAVELFSDLVIERDDDVIAVLSRIGDLLGHALDRLRTEAELRKSEQGLADAQRLAHIGSWTWDVGADDVVWSAELHRIYGLPEEASPVSFDDYVGRVDPRDREKVVDAVRRAVETLEPYEHDYRIVWPDGTVRWVHAAGEVTRHADGFATRLGGFCHDVTQEREAEDRRRAAQEALASHRQILERIARGEPLAATLDALCRDVEARSPGAMCSILTVAPDAPVLRHAAAPSLPGAFQSAIDGLPINDDAGACGRAAFRRHDVVVVDTFADTLTKEFVSIAHEHQLRAVWSHPLITSSGRLLGTFAVYRSEPYTPDPNEREAVTAAASIAAVAIERATAETALTAAARLDPLTGLPNRATFLNQLTYNLDHPGRRTAVLFCDLDGFKWINDSLGHSIGDRILVDVAWRLERALDGHHLLARFGGDEFTVLVHDADDPEVDVRAVADGLVKALAAPFHLDGGEFYVSVSVGIAIADDDEAGASDLLRDADAAMYAAKERGRSRLAVFDRTLRDRATARLTVEAELRRALDRDEIVMHYQPIIDLRTGQLAGLESLVRWQHPRRGLVSPDEFIPLAEETGLIIPLGELILVRVLVETAELDIAHICINVSAVQLADPHFAEVLASALSRHPLDSRKLVVEVTETALMQRVDLARAALEEVASLGIGILIDDFGTGYSSIARLRELPVTGVKIDRSFTAELGVNAETDRLVAAIADLAHAVNLEVILEGIEAPAAAARAAELQCEFGQGYFYARPAALTDLQLPT
jgi:c-di-GMP-specific phosphodiesterase